MLTGPSWTYSISERATFVGSGLSPRQLFREVPLYELTSAHALAQHMGVPTRLLDFSDHPLKAAFFALGPEGDGEFFAVESEYLCVWAAKPPISDDGSDVLSRLRGEIHRQVSVLRVLRSQIVNLHAQDGLFLSCNESANLHFLRHGEWPSLDQLMDGWQLEKLTLPSGEGPVLRRVLERLAIDSTTMMPSYKQAADDALRLLG